MLNAKTLKRLVLITTICTVPVVMLVVKNSTSAIRNNQVAFLPDLLKQQDQIIKISLQDREHTLTLQKIDGAWIVAERNNYPVLTSKVEELLYNLADLRVIEPKTANRELFKQVDLNSLDDKDSKTLQISVTDLYNDNIAKIYVGKREGVRLGEEYQEHIFVRKVDEDQAWLVQGVLPQTNDFRDWVEQPLLGLVESQQIKSVEIDKPNGNRVIIAKTKQDQEDFSLETLSSKQGMTLDLDAVNTVPFEIAELEFADVQPDRSDINWNNGLKATLETFPGVKVMISMVKDGQKVLAKVHADLTQIATPEVQQKVMSFNSAKQPWIYELYPEIYQELALSNEDFLKPQESE